MSALCTCNQVQNLLYQDNYLIQRYGQVTPVTGKIKRTYARKAYPDGKWNDRKTLLDLRVTCFADEHPDFIAYARELAHAVRQTIFVDQVGHNLSEVFTDLI